MNSLFSAYTSFTAFGAAIFVVIGAGGAVETLGKRWSDHAKKEDASRLAWLRNPIVVILTAIPICAIVICAGLGLLFTYLWLQGGQSGGSRKFFYDTSVVLFYVEVGLITIISTFAVIAAALSAIGAAFAARTAGQEADQARATP